MIEFVGSKEILDFAKEEGFNTIQMTFEDTKAHNRDAYNVFEVSEEEFEKMCNYEDENDVHIVGEKKPIWKNSWGWWRYSGGCNLEGVAPTTWDMTINNHRLIAWYDENGLKEYFDENKDDGDIESVFDEWMDDHDKYDSLFDYCLEMWGCSTEHNVTAIAVGLAKLNKMSLADLFKLTT